MATPPHLISKKFTWQAELSNAISNVHELCDLLELSQQDLELDAEQTFSFKVPRSFVDRMQKKNPRDPLLLQVLPTLSERLKLPGFELDPLHEKEVNPVPGLLHKYSTRVLVTLASACAINCRYCFRRHFPYANNNPGKEGWQKIFTYIKNNIAINEVILSGGDPLMQNDHTIKKFTDELQKISHIKTLRIHSRMPIVIPKRISQDFLALLSTLPFRIVMVMHANHAREINKEVKDHLLLLKNVGVTLLNQSVLLKNVNDTVEALVNLSEKLFDAHTLPYYLHMLDKVAGASHFDVTKARAKYLYTEIKKFLPGYLVPRLVFEEAGKANKTLINED